MVERKAGGPSSQALRAWYKQRLGYWYSSRVSSFVLVSASVSSLLTPYHGGGGS